jgi:hypothetical protein
VIDLFLKLIDKGIELLREGERRKKQFFEEVVKPIQALFQKMYDDHIKTFADTRSMLLSEKSKSRDIVSLVEGRLLFAHGTTELLYRLTGTGGNIGVKIGRLRGSLRDDFDEYVSDIAKLVSLSIAYNSTDGALLEACHYRLAAGEIGKVVDLLRAKKRQGNELRD